MYHFYYQITILFFKLFMLKYCLLVCCFNVMMKTCYSTVFVRNVLFFKSLFLENHFLSLSFLIFSFKQLIFFFLFNSNCGCISFQLPIFKLKPWKLYFVVSNYYTFIHNYYILFIIKQKYQTYLMHIVINQNFVYKTH